DGETETGLVGRVVGGDVRAPDAIALLEPKRVDRPVAAADEAVRTPCSPERVEEHRAELGRAVELPTELADVRDANGQAGRRPDGEFARVHVREGAVREVGGGERLQDLSRRRAPEPEAGVARGHVLDAH